MTPEQFCYWLQGRAEMQPSNPPSAEEWLIIGAHLQWALKRETRGNSFIKHIGEMPPSSSAVIPKGVPNDVPVTSLFDEYCPGGDELAKPLTVTCR